MLFRWTYNNLNADPTDQADLHGSEDIRIDLPLPFDPRSSLLKNARSKFVLDLDRIDLRLLQFAAVVDVERFPLAEYI